MMIDQRRNSPLKPGKEKLERVEAIANRLSECILEKQTQVWTEEEIKRSFDNLLVYKNQGKLQAKYFHHPKKGITMVWQDDYHIKHTLCSVVSALEETESDSETRARFSSLITYVIDISPLLFDLRVPYSMTLEEWMSDKMHVKLDHGPLMTWYFTNHHGFTHELSIFPWPLRCENRKFDTKLRLCEESIKWMTLDAVAMPSDQLASRLFPCKPEVCDVLMLWNQYTKALDATSVLISSFQYLCQFILIHQLRLKKSPYAEWFFNHFELHQFTLSKAIQMNTNAYFLQAMKQNPLIFENAFPYVFPNLHKMCLSNGVILREILEIDVGDYLSFDCIPKALKYQKEVLKLSMQNKQKAACMQFFKSQLKVTYFGTFITMFYGMKHARSFYLTHDQKEKNKMNEYPQLFLASVMVYAMHNTPDALIEIAMSVLNQI